VKLSRDKMSKYKVLIVEDDLFVRDTLKEMLSTLDHTYNVASNGVEALNKATREHFDAIITDVHMPRMDGIALTRELSRRNPSIPIMVMTGYYDPETAENAVAGGASVFLSKPFTATEFFDTFNAMMRGH
jgi:two-component system, OmpR family, response regulator MprA